MKKSFILSTAISALFTTSVLADTNAISTNAIVNLISTNIVCGTNLTFIKAPSFITIHEDYTNAQGYVLESNVLMVDKNKKGEWEIIKTPHVKFDKAFLPNMNLKKP